LVQLTTGYCAYHDDSGNPYYQGAVTGADVPLHQSSLHSDSYADYPTGCSGGQVPTPNDLEGVTYTAAHEYYETLTDPYPATGWTDSQGYEVADKCDYLNAGLPGAETSLVLSTGSFPVPGMWSNDLNKGKGGCTTSHPLVVVAGLAKQHAQAGVPVSLQIVATDYAGSTLSYSASGLPTGLSIDPGSGLISGTPSGRQASPPRWSPVTVFTPPQHVDHLEGQEGPEGIVTYGQAGLPGRSAQDVLAVEVKGGNAKECRGIDHLDDGEMGEPTKLGRLEEDLGPQSRAIVGDRQP